MTRYYPTKYHSKWEHQYRISMWGIRIKIRKKTRKSGFTIQGLGQSQLRFKEEVLQLELWHFHVAHMKCFPPLCKVVCAPPCRRSGWGLRCCTNCPKQRPQGHCKTRPAAPCVYLWQVSGAGLKQVLHRRPSWLGRRWARHVATQLNHRMWVAMRWTFVCRWANIS